MNTLDTSMSDGKGKEGAAPFVPAPARLPIFPELATELAGWVGRHVCVKTPGYKGQESISGTLLTIFKGTGGDLILKIRATNEWRNTETRESIPSEHLIPYSKVLQLSRAEKL